MSLLSTIVTAVLGNDAANKQRDAIVDGNKEAVALAKTQYDQTRADYAPFRELGYDAVNGANGLRALLGLGPQSATSSIAPVSSAVGFDANAYLSANPDIGAHWQTLTANQKRQYPTPQAFAAYHYDTVGRLEGRPVGPASAAGASANPSSAPAAGGNGILEALRSTPGYEFQLGEGTRAIESSLAARGLSNSGAAQKALQKYGQGLADQTYGQAVDRMFQAANVGAGGTAAVTSAGSSYAQTAGQAALNKGDANANRAVSRAGIWSQAIEGIEDAASTAGGYSKLFKLG